MKYRIFPEDFNSIPISVSLQARAGFLYEGTLSYRRREASYSASNCDSEHFKQDSGNEGIET